MSNLKFQTKFDINNVSRIMKESDEENFLSGLYYQAEEYVIKQMTDFNGSPDEKQEHNRILNACIMGDKGAQKQVKAMIKKFITESCIIPVNYIEKITQQIYIEKYGLGAIDDLIYDTTINEIWVNGKDHIWIDRGGLKKRLPRKYKSNDDVMRIIRHILQFDQKEVTLQNPMAESRMLDGSRITVSIPPIAKTPYINIRKFDSFELTTENLIKKGTLNSEMVDWIAKAIKGRSNILIIGECGSGKTSLLNWLTQFINPSLRIGTIETNFELKLDEKFPERNIFCFEEHPELGIYLVDLFKLILRCSPDIIIVGESRSFEAIEMIKAMRRAHPGSMSTAHTNSAETAIDDIATMINEDGKTRDPNSLRYMIANALDVIIQINRDEETGIRRITRITEVVDDANTYSFKFNDIFLYKKNSENLSIGSFEKVNSITSQYAEKLSQRLPKSLINEM